MLAAAAVQIMAAAAQADSAQPQGCQYQPVLPLRLRLVQAVTVVKTNQVCQQVAAIPYLAQSHQTVAVGADITAILDSLLLPVLVVALAAVVLLIPPVVVEIPRLLRPLKAIAEAAQIKALQTLRQAVAVAQLRQEAAERHLLVAPVEAGRHQAYPAHL